MAFGHVRILLLLFFGEFISNHLQINNSIKGFPLAQDLDCIFSFFLGSSSFTILKERLQ